MWIVRLRTGCARARGCVRGAGLFEGLNFPSIKLDKTRSRSSRSKVFGVLPRNHHCLRTLLIQHGEYSGAAYENTTHSSSMASTMVLHMRTLLTHPVWRVQWCCIWEHYSSSMASTVVPHMRTLLTHPVWRVQWCCIWEHYSSSMASTVVPHMRTLEYYSSSMASTMVLHMRTLLIQHGEYSGAAYENTRILLIQYGEYNGAAYENTTHPAWRVQWCRIWEH